MLRVQYQFACLVIVFASIPTVSAEDKFLESNGVKLRYVAEGEGEPVILIHGFSVDLDRQWRAPGVIGALSKSHRVIAYDNRGHGKSGKPHDPKQYGIEMVEDAVRLMDHLQIKKAHVVGYSMGASITNKLLTVHPDRLLTATLGGSAGTLEGDPVFLSDEFAGEIESGKGIGRLMNVLTPNGQPKLTDEQLKAINAGFYALNDSKALAAAIREMKTLSIPRAKATENKLPVLGLIGSRDPLKVRVDAMAVELAGMTTFVLPGADHMTAVARPEFVKELTAFLGKYRSN